LLFLNAPNLLGPVYADPADAARLIALPYKNGFVPKTNARDRKTPRYEMTGFELTLLIGTNWTGIAFTGCAGRPLEPDWTFDIYVLCGGRKFGWPKPNVLMWKWVDLLLVVMLEPVEELHDNYLK
jgi:hypothetical protein